MEFIFDLPISFYEHYDNNVIFTLAQRIDEYREIKNFNHSRVFLDNGAWVKDGGKAMDVKEYVAIISEINPMWAVVPDKLGDFKTSTRLAEEFFQEKKRVDLSHNYLVCPLQGHTITEIMQMAMMYKVDDLCKGLGTQLIFGLSKGTYDIPTPDRRRVIETIKQFWPHSKFHLLGFDFGPFDVPFETLDTKWPVKKALKDSFDVDDRYYDIQWDHLTTREQKRVDYWLKKCGNPMPSKELDF